MGFGGGGGSSGTDVGRMQRADCDMHDSITFCCKQAGPTAPPAHLPRKHERGPAEARHRQAAAESLGEHVGVLPPRRPPHHVGVHVVHVEHEHELHRDSDSDMMMAVQQLMAVHLESTSNRQTQRAPQQRCACSGSNSSASTCAQHPRAHLCQQH